MSINILTGQILDKMPDIGKWQKQFMMHLFSILLTIRGRHNFENLSRYGCYNELTYRTWYGREFDFLGFNKALILSLPAEERIIAFDPSYLPKHGKSTPGVGYFWSGCAGVAQYGLEIAGFASVGLQTHTAMHLYAKQTIIQDDHTTLLNYYGSLVAQQVVGLRALSTTIVADAYFSRKPFVDIVTKHHFHLVSKLASNAILQYPYLGPSTGKKGRPKKYAGNVDKLNLDSTYFTLSYCQDGVKAYEGNVYVKAFSRLLKCVIVHKPTKKTTPKVEAFFSTDTEMQGIKVWNMYKLRFQRGRPAIEFLYRDGKQHTGLSQGQARHKQKIHTHVNASLTAVSLAKAVHYLSKPKEDRGAFSMASMKSQYFNEHLLDRFFVEFGKVPEHYKNSPQYQVLYNYGCIAA